MFADPVCSLELWLENDIQLPYCNKFPSVWEYNRAFSDGLLDFRDIVGPTCPICGRRECWREIKAYRRRVVELFPFREGSIFIARFQCRKTGRTFSLLPIQLAPYLCYTVTAMLSALLVAYLAYEEDGLSLASVAEKRLDANSRVNGYLLDCWLRRVLAGFRRGHAWVGLQADLSVITSEDPSGRLVELHDYLSAVLFAGECHEASSSSRAPPVTMAKAVERLLERYSRQTQHFLIGSPSQSRLVRCAP